MSQSESFCLFLSTIILFNADRTFSSILPIDSRSPGILANTTLDTKNDLPNPDWVIKGFFPKWFEYYNDTSELLLQQDNNGICSSVVASVLPNLSEVDGIWVTCQDPSLGEDCMDAILGCHPSLKYNDRSFTENPRTIKLSFAVHGIGILRLTVLDSCFDFSTRKDPFSPCAFRQLEQIPEGGWQQELFTFPPSGDQFERFEIDLISRYAHDVVLLDKVETTDYLICGSGTTCEPPPEIKTSTTTTTTTTTTAPPSSPPPFNISTTPGPIDSPNITLDTARDMTGNWNFVEFTPGYLEYYNDTNWENTTNPKSSCTQALSRIAQSFPLSEGIWAACQTHSSYGSDFSKCYNQGQPRPCNPYIKRSPNDHHSLRTVKIRFNVQELAILRLTIDDLPITERTRCFDYSSKEDPFSACEYIEVGQSAEEKTAWYDGMFSLGPGSSQTFIGFTIEPIARFKNDVVLIDKVETTSEGFPECDNDNSCFSISTSTGTTISFPPSKSTTAITTTKITSTTKATPNVASFFVHNCVTLFIFSCYSVFFPFGL